MKFFVLVAGAIFTLLTTAAQAAVTTNERIPINQTVFIPCANGGAGENVTLSGPLHVLEDVTINGSHVHLKVQANPQDVFGVGSVTGATFKATGITLDSVNFNEAGFPAEETFVNNFRIIGKGLTGNLLVHETFHITINANGTVTNLLDHVSVDCAH